MEFRSLLEIINHFHFDDNEPTEILKKLKKLRKKKHPDKNDGTFKNASEEEKFHDIQQAISFLNDKNKDLSISITSKNDITALTNIVKDLIISQKKETSTENIQQKELFFTGKVEQSVKNFHRQSVTPKITSLILTTIISTLWLIPNIVKDHPLLSFIYNYKTLFTIIWILSILITCIFWIKIKSIEKKDELLKQNYKLETTQNRIFSLFIKWISIDYRKIRRSDDYRKSFYKFSKDDLVNFLIDQYKKIEDFHQYNNYENQSHFLENLKSLKEQKLSSKNKTFGLNYILQKYYSIFPKPGEIDIEIAELLSDLIIERLSTKQVIIKSSEKSLSDMYEYEKDNY